MNSLRNRLETFVDGVIAIAITLLAIELPIPDILSNIGNTSNPFTPHIHELGAFILSFITIAIFWVNHHRLTQHLGEHIQRRIVWATMAFLLFQTLIPFATKSLIFNNFHGLSISMYSITLLGASLSFSILHYVTHNQNYTKLQFMRTIIGPTAYACASISALLIPLTAFIFLAIPPLYYFLPKSSTLPIPKKKPTRRKMTKK